MKARVIGMNNGLMVYWEEIKQAAQYHVHLLIGDKNRHQEIQNGQQRWVDEKEEFLEIALIDIERTIKYHSFTDLARIDRQLVYRYNTGNVQEDTGRNYYIFVEAEDREGKIIDKTDKIICHVKEMWNGSAL